MAAKKPSGTRARKSGARRARPTPKSRRLQGKLLKLYREKVELDLQIFAIQMQLATSRDKAGTGFCFAP